MDRCVDKTTHSDVALSVLYVFLPFSVHFVLFCLSLLCFCLLLLFYSACVFAFFWLVTLLISLQYTSLILPFCLYIFLRLCFCLSACLSLSLSLSVYCIFLAVSFNLSTERFLFQCLPPVSLTVFACIFFLSEPLSIAELLFLSPSSFTLSLLIPVDRLDSSLFRPLPSSACLSFRAVASLLS